MVLKGIEMSQRVYETFFPALGFSQLWLYLPLPVSATIMLVHGLAFVAADLAVVRSASAKGKAR
jgi:TRAP-type C4-dicarboxylate transport system permease small subunit